MPEDSTLESSIDPRMGTTELAEGADVHVRDELGKRHNATIIAVHEGDPLTYTALLTCHGKLREVAITERDVLARVTSERYL